MRRDRWLPSDDAVSPVVGTVLLVGIAVTVMGVLAVFVLGFVAGGGAPNADFMFAQDANKNVTITLTSGESLPSDQLRIMVGSQTVCSGDDAWSGSVGTSDTVIVVNDSYGGGGHDCTYDPNVGDVVRVVWSSPSSGSEQILGEWTVFDP